MYSLWVKSKPPRFINKILLEYSLAHSFMYCLWLLVLQQAEPNSCDRSFVAHKPNIVMIWPFTEKFPSPWHRQNGLKCYFGTLKNQTLESLGNRDRRTKTVINPSKHQHIFIQIRRASQNYKISCLKCLSSLKLNQWV